MVSCMRTRSVNGSAASRGRFARGAAACAVFAFGHKSLPIRIASARRAELTCVNRFNSVPPTRTPNTYFTFYKGNLFFNFPVLFVWRVDISLMLPANVIVHESQICRVSI